MASYKEIYDIATRYFSWKRERLQHMLRDRLVADFGQVAESRPVDLVDFGSGDGTMILDILWDMPEEMRSALRVTCVEPDDSNFAALTNIFNENADWFPNFTLYKGTMADYLATHPDKFDAALMTHMLYHLPRETWPDEITAALRQTSGHAYITLVEEEGSHIYEIARDTMTAQADGAGAIGGDYIFAKHLDEALEKVNTGGIEKFPNKGALSIPLTDRDAFIKAAKENSEDLTRLPFVRFLGFVLRKTEEEIAADKPFIDAMVRHFETRPLLLSTDTIYRISPC